MSAADLNLPTVELTSTLLTAPLNGAPSSADYNESQRNNLVDLTSLADFINNQLLPLINALPAGALLPTNSPVGIEGRTINTNTADLSFLFFDSLSSEPLTIYQSLQLLNGIITTMSQQLTDQGVEIAVLQAQLSSTNQNDIALALQNLSASLNQLTVNQQIQNTQITEIIGAKIVTVRSASTPCAPSSVTSITVNFPTPYSDDFYTAAVNIEIPAAADGLVSVGGFKKISPGIGLTVPVTNYDVTTQNVIVHVIASHD